MSRSEAVAPGEGLRKKTFALVMGKNMHMAEMKMNFKLGNVWKLFFLSKNLFVFSGGYPPSNYFQLSNQKYSHFLYPRCVKNDSI